MDLGECPRVHDLALRADYQLAAKDKDYFYDVDVSIVTIRKQDTQKPDTFEIGHFIVWISNGINIRKRY